MSAITPAFQPPPTAPMAVAEPATSSVATLLVRHLPEAIPQEMLTRLFSHYGAANVRPCAGGKMRNCAFVDFKDEVTANQALSQLNRLRFLGKVLIVERANKSNPKNMNQRHQEQPVQAMSHQTMTVPSDSVDRKASTFAAEPIAPRLGVDYPFPPHLVYQYPPPDGNILTNIVNALIAVPRFYTQVLHLMNKMNIPAPFHMALPTPPLPPQTAPAPPPPPPPSDFATENSKPTDLSSDESEMESSDEDVDGKRRKRARHEAIVGPAVDKNVAHETVGLKPAALVPKEVPKIKKTPMLQINIGAKALQKEPPSLDSDIKKLDQGEENTGQKQFAEPHEISKGKLPLEQLLSLPMFKNYAPGNPANVLYIKNLGKDVVNDDFYFIFGSLFENLDAARSSLGIKLMQEGRMRGQAFVTFPSIELAQNALNLINGYVFKGKPMIIQFGRNPAANKPS